MGKIILGKIGAPHGVKGFVTLHSYTEPKAAILNYPEWFIHFKTGPKILKLLEYRAEGARLLGLFEGFEDRTEAQSLRNLEISVPRESLPALPEGEYYWADLIGLAVTNESGFSFGIIEGLIETGSNDVIIVKGDKEYLIPYIPKEVILSVNLGAKQMTVDWDPEF